MELLGDARCNDTAECEGSDALLDLSGLRSSLTDFGVADAVIENLFFELDADTDGLVWRLLPQ